MRGEAGTSHLGEPWVEFKLFPGHSTTTSGSITHIRKPFTIGVCIRTCARAYVWCQVCKRQATSVCCTMQYSITPTPTHQHTHTHTNTRTPPHQHPHTHTHTNTHTPTHTPTHTHTHTHTCTLHTCSSSLSTEVFCLSVTLPDPRSPVDANDTPSLVHDTAMESLI